MEHPQGKGAFWGIVGATIGGIGWIIILGIVLRSPAVVTISTALGVTTLFVSLKLYRIRPDRAFAVIGIVILWLIIINSIFLNVLFEMIPETLGFLTTGKSRFSLIMLNIQMGIFSIVGFFFLILDVINSGKSLSTGGNVKEDSR